MISIMRKLLTIIMVLTFACGLGLTMGSALPEGVSVTGTGDAVYVDLDIYDVTLPTAGSLDFLLDPLGLLSLEPGQSAPLEALNGGWIVHAGDARVINNSTHSVKVSIELRAESTNGGYEYGAIASFMDYTVDDETTIGSVEAGENTANNILLYAVPSADSLPNLEAPFIPAATGFVITAASRTLEFILPAALYSITMDMDEGIVSAPIPDTGSGIALKFGGNVNTNADWSDFVAENEPSTITVYATFTLARAELEDLDEAETPRMDGIPKMLAPVPEDALKLD